MPDESAAALAGLEVWVVDALRYSPHPSHLQCLADALAWIERHRRRRAILTNLHSDLDYETAEQLPPNVEPAYDGMQWNWAKPRLKY